MENNNKININFGFGSILAIVFVVLKLCGVIDWAWVWVLAPLWIGVIITIICTILIVVIKKFWD